MTKKNSVHLKLRADLCDLSNKCTLNLQIFELSKYFPSKRNNLWLNALKYFLTDPVHGNYSEWSEFTDCSKTCEGGQKHRKRTCTNPSPGLGGNDCAGLGRDVEYIDCNSDVRCPGIQKSKYETDWTGIRSFLLFLSH